MSAIKVYRNAAWEQVDLKGLPGDPGAAGAAGVFTWPASNYRNFTNNMTVGDGVFEPTALSTANTGSNPATKVNAANTSRVEILRSGVFYFDALFASAVVMNGPSFVNIRRVNGDVVLNSSTIMAGETDIAATAVFPATVGEIIRFLISKNTGSTGGVSTTIRTVLLV